MNIDNYYCEFVYLFTFAILCNNLLYSLVQYIRLTIQCLNQDDQKSPSLKTLQNGSKTNKDTHKTPYKANQIICSPQNPNSFNVSDEM